MRKEVILALIIGIIIGGVILYGLKIANQSATTEVSETENTITNPTVTPTPSQDLIINTPENHTVTFEDQITINGKTLPNTNLAIITEDEDDLIQSDKQGLFSTTVDLTEGENKIIITAIISDENQPSKELLVIYTQDKIEDEN